MGPPLLLLVMLAWVWLGRPVDHAGWTEAGGAAAEDLQRAADLAVGRISTVAAQAPDRAVVPPAALPSRYVRGPHQRHLYPPARTVKRDSTVGRVFAEPLLVARNGPAVGELTRNEHVISAIEAWHDPEAVLRFIESDARLLDLPLDGNRKVRVEVAQILRRGPHTHTMAGKVLGDPFSDVLMVFHDGAVSGAVAFHDRNQHYEFGSAGNGDVAVRLLDPFSFSAPCGDPGNVEEADAGGTVDGETPASGETGEVQDESTAAVVMDTVVGYGAQARAAEGGVAAMEARIIVSVDRMNLAFANSLVADTAAELLGTIEDPYYVFPGAVAGEMGSADELGDLNDPRDGILDTVTDLRDELGADQASFVVKQSDGSAGIAYRPGRSLIVARDYMTSTRMTFEHEFGHNLGARHAWGDTTSDSVKSGNNWGWRFDPPGAAVPVRTIMAYDWGWGNGSRVPHFSNPAVSYNGARTGAVNGYNATGDPTADPRAVSGGLIGTAGAGYNGSNPTLGANNASMILSGAPTMAARATRAIIEQEIQVEGPGPEILVAGSSVVELMAPGIGQTARVTISIRNLGVLDLEGLSVVKSGENAANFVIVSQPAATLAGSAATGFDVVFTPSFAGQHTATLAIASNDSDENPFIIQLRGTVKSKRVFASLGGFTIPSIGNAAPYPGSIDVSGVTGDLLSFKVLLNGLSHSYPSDLGIHLLSPAGRVCVLMSDCGGGTKLVNVDLAFTDVAPSGLTASGAISPGVYRPSDPFPGEPRPPGGTGPVVTNLDALTADGVNGEWKLFIVDDTNGDSGSLAGWSIELETDGPDFEESAFAAWLEAAGLTDDRALAGAVPFGDGVSNLLKFAFGLNGAAADHRALVPGSGMSGLPVVWRDEADGEIVFEYIERTDAGLVYEAVESASLAGSGWRAATGERSEVPAGDGWKRVRIRHARPEGALFFAVRVVEAS